MMSATRYSITEEYKNKTQILEKLLLIPKSRINLIKDYLDIKYQKLKYRLYQEWIYKKAQYQIQLNLRREEKEDEILKRYMNYKDQAEEILKRRNELWGDKNIELPFKINKLK